jgi:hypothetical protein
MINAQNGNPIGIISVIYLYFCFAAGKITGKIFRYCVLLLRIGTVYWYYVNDSGQ